MNQSKKDNSNTGNELPTVSGSGSRREGDFTAPPPRVEGYEIISELGQAGQGHVWRARQLSTNREVALKVPRIDLLGSRKALARFEREVELAARLKHQNIAAIYDSGIYQGIYYYAMELVDGKPLDEYAKQCDLSERQIAELMRTICRAVQHAHQNGVIHRDIKPSNIMVTEDGQPHVVDFGLAMNILDGDTMKTVSAAGEVTGTPAYMSPEQATGNHDQIDTRTDVYSIGVVFYRLVTGDFPYDVKSSMLDTLRNIQETDPIRPSKVVRGLDGDIEAIVLKALAKDPDRRYQTVAEMQNDIERWLDGLAILAKADNTIYMLRKTINKHRYAATVLTLLAIIIFGYACVVVQLFERLRRSNAERADTIKAAEEQLETNTQITKLESFGHLLDDWHRDNWQGVRFAVLGFRGSAREDKAARLLFAQMLDEKPLPEKLAAFDKQFEKSEPAFLDFLTAENYFKNNKHPEAMQAYSRCLESHRDDLYPDRWLAVRARSRLHELAAENLAVQTSAKVGGD